MKPKLLHFKQFDQKANDLANKVILAAESGDRVKHWKAVADLLRYQNKKARKEQDKVAKECAEVRSAKLFKKTKSKTMGLRFGVSMPPLTWNALVSADRIAYGRSDLAEYDKEADMAGLEGSNQVVKDLAKAFPQYRVS